MNNKLIIENLNNDEVVGYPTDTVFGLVVKLKRENISKLNNIKKRNQDTPLQILFSSIDEAAKYFENDYFVMEYLANNYKEKTSYIVKAKKNFINKYLIGTFNQTFMFRIPDGEILEIIKEVGPLFATSANLHNEEPIKEPALVKETFNIIVSDIKQDSNQPSDIISLIKEEVRKIR